MSNSTSNQKLIWQHLQVALFFGVPLVFLLLPKDYFDKGTPICLSVRFFNLECPGCGLTRATQHLIHFDWKTAIYYNWLVFVTTPLICWVWWDYFKPALLNIWKHYTSKAQA